MDNQDYYNWGGVTRIRARINFRPVNPHNNGALKPEVKAADGYEGVFSYCWQMDEDDPYPGESAWSPAREYAGGDFPNDIRVGWFASGDLELIEELTWTNGTNGNDENL